LISWFNSYSPTLEQHLRSLEIQVGILFPDLIRRRTFTVDLFRLTVSGEEAAIVAHHYPLVRLGDQVLRHNGNLSAAARRIDDKLGDRQSRGMTPETFDDFDSLLHRGSKVLNAFREIALI